MIFNPHIPVFAIIIIAIVSSLAITLLYFRAPWLSKAKRLTVLMLRILVIALLTIILLNPVKEKEIIQNNIPRKNIVLLDQSTSMNVGSGESRWNQMMNDVMPLMKKQFNPSVEWVLFDSLCTPIDSPYTWYKQQATGASTYLIASIEEAIQLHKNESLNHIVICTDGQTTDKQRVKVAIAAAINCGASISVMGYGEKSINRNASIANVDVITDAKPNEKLTIHPILDFIGLAGESFQLQLFKDGKLIDEVSGTAVEGSQHVSMDLTTGTNASEYELKLKPFNNELTTNDNQCKFNINVSSPKIRVLYMEGSSNAYSKPSGGICNPYQFIEEACLKTEEIEIDCYVLDNQNAVGGEIFNVKNNKKGYPKTKEELNEYDVVICSDINRSVFNDQQLQWTSDLVAKNGGGFCMIGGITSFGAGGWDKTALEKIIPVDMEDFGQGTTWDNIRPTIPKESLSHPIWQLGKTHEESMNIIKTHPPFHGTNIVKRAKPGATVLAYWKERQNMPLISVQSYGKGRSMAFTSDAAGDWGIGYQNAWGPSRQNNAYYRKFWANTVMWLGENSVRSKKDKLVVSTDKINYATNSEVLFSVVLNDKDYEYNVEANVKECKLEPIKFKPIGDGRYKGNWIIPQNFASNTATFIVKASHPNHNSILTDSIKINVSPSNNEFLNSDPDFELLKKLMVMTGGKNLKSANELEELLQNSATVVKEKAMKTTIPIWDNWFLLMLIVLLWSAEWVIRKWG